MNFNYDEDSDLSVREILIKNKLADEEGNLLQSESLPVNPSWGLGPYAPWQCMIYLCTLVHFFKEKCMLENLEIAINKTDDIDYEILINEKDRRYDYAHPFWDWSIVLDTIDHLYGWMAGSNQTYLAGQLFFNT